MRILTLLVLASILSAHSFGQSSGSNDLPPCAADARFSNSNGSLNYSRSSPVPVSLSLLVHLSKPGECSSAEITLTATFLTDTQDFICSGTIRQAMIMTAEVQTFNLELRPFTQLDFLRWRNQPGIRGTQQGKRLVCSNLDGTTDAGDTDRQKASWLRLSVGVLPQRGGLAVAEAIMRISP